MRLGPVAFSFAGKVGFVELDQAKGLAVINASGSDTKGRGAANGTVRCQLEADGDGTRVSLVSAVDLSGSVAQYGRGQGMITDLTQQLVNRFAENLETLARPTAPAAPAAAGEPVKATSAPPAAPAASAPDARVGGLLAGVLWRAVLRFIGRLFGRVN